MKAASGVSGSQSLQSASTVAFVVLVTSGSTVQIQSTETICKHTTFQLKPSPDMHNLVSLLCAGRPRMPD